MADPKHNPNSQYEQSPVIRWRCPNCGQTLFTDPEFEPPDLCAYCNDMTTWQRVDDHNNTPAN